MAHSEAPVTILSEDACWGLLAGLDVGRLATVADDAPEIFPINYVVDGTSVVFRTADGSKLAELTNNAHVAFEVDTWDLEGGKSVVLKGTATEITDPEELSRARALPLRPWIDTVKTHFVRVSARDISGRVFRFGPNS